MPQSRLPEALGEYAHRPVARFHMPGHKARGMGGFFQAELAGWDITELSFSDDLHNPSDAIQQAQEACAAIYGAAHTFFLVNGATSGIHAMLLSLARGAHLLLSRDCHKAVLNGAALAGHTVSFVQPPLLEEEEVCGCTTPEAIDEALSHCRADAVVVTSPTYYGLCANLSAIADIVHAHGALLFVDAAHGAHFPYSDNLPNSPAGYADAWVHSAHKTLNALGQAAMLHIGPHMCKNAIQRALSIVQTSSPSYLLLASLDWARYTAALPGVWASALKNCHALSLSISHVPGLQVLSRAYIGRAGIADVDPMRIVIDVGMRGVTGYAAQRELECRDIYVEMADHRRLVLICTPADDPKWYPLLLDALEGLPYSLSPPACLMMAYPVLAQAMPLYEAARAVTTPCALADAAGYIAAESVGAYPPGIPLWVAGERITQDAVEQLLRQHTLGAVLFGVRQGYVHVVKE